MRSSELLPLNAFQNILIGHLVDQMQMTNLTTKLDVFSILGRCTTNKGWWDTYCYSDDLNFDGCATHTYALCETSMK